MKPHLVIWLRPGVPHREVGSWLQAISDPSAAGPPFQPEIDRAMSAHASGWMVTHEHEPARTDGWSLDEKAFGLDRKFRVVSLGDRPFSADVVTAVRELPVVERVETGQLASSRIPMASSMGLQPSEWAGRAIGLDEAHRQTRGSSQVTIRLR